MDAEFVLPKIFISLMICIWFRWQKIHDAAKLFCKTLQILIYNISDSSDINLQYLNSLFRFKCSQRTNEDNEINISRPKVNFWNKRIISRPPEWEVDCKLSLFWKPDLSSVIVTTAIQKGNAKCVENHHKNVITIV